MDLNVFLMLGFFIKAISSNPQCGGGNSTTNDFIVRLSGTFGSTPAGMVEICVNGSWAALVVDQSTDSSWTMLNSIVTCRSLGYQSAVNVQLGYYERSYQILSGGQYYGVLATGKIECTGRESTIQQCITEDGGLSYSSVESLDMKYDQPIVLCQDPVHGDVRLSGSTDPSQGIVEVYSSYYGWSTVCTDGWNDEEAEVVCKSMGYGTGYKETTKYSFLGLPMKRYNNFKCAGSEQNLLNCDYTGPYPGGCRSAFPARISCQPSTMLNTTIYDVLTSGNFILLGGTVALLIVVQVLILLIAVLILLFKRRMNSSNVQRDHSVKHCHGHKIVAMMKYGFKKLLNKPPKTVATQC